MPWYWPFGRKEEPLVIVEPLSARTAAFKEQVDALEAEVGKLLGQIKDRDGTIQALLARNATLNDRLSSLEEYDSVVENLGDAKQSYLDALDPQNNVSAVRRLNLAILFRSAAKKAVEYLPASLIDENVDRAVAAVDAAIPEAIAEVAALLESAKRAKEEVLAAAKRFPHSSAAIDIETAAQALQDEVDFEASEFLGLLEGESEDIQEAAHRALKMDWVKPETLET